MRSCGLPYGLSLMGLHPPFLRTLTIICFCLVPLTRFHCLDAQIIPAVTGRVVDGITGRPIQGISLTLQISTYEGWSVHTEVKNTATSDHAGRFSLSGASHPVASPLNQIRSYWLTVNEGLEETGQEENSAATRILYNPMSNGRGEAVGDKRYFPLTVTFRPDGCDRVWTATCMYIASAIALKKGVEIQLVPKLDEISACQGIGDPRLRENCRQLNTYRAAFLHVGTYEEMNKGKQLCAEVDGGVISSVCLYELPVYDANPQAYDRKVVPQTNEPVLEGMFPDSIAGLPAMKNGCGPQISNDGRVNCAGGYGTISRQLVAVYFERWPENTPKLKEWSHLDPTAKWSHLQDPEVNEEVRGGGKVLRCLGKWYSGVEGVDGRLVQTEHKATSYVWFSANTIVEVQFYDPMPQQEAFLSYYLGKFPSTSK
jgi:hypothetical protein